MHQHKAQHRYKKEEHFEMMLVLPTSGEKILSLTGNGDLRQKEKKDVGEKIQAYDFLPSY